MPIYIVVSAGHRYLLYFLSSSYENLWYIDLTPHGVWLGHIVRLLWSQDALTCIFGHMARKHRYPFKRESGIYTGLWTCYTVRPQTISLVTSNHVIRKLTRNPTLFSLSFSQHLFFLTYFCI